MRPNLNKFLTNHESNQEETNFIPSETNKVQGADNTAPKSFIGSHSKDGKIKVADLLRSSGVQGMKDTGETKFMDTEQYRKYTQKEEKGVSPFAFQSNYELSRALNQSNWEQTGHVAAKIIPNTVLEFTGMLGNVLDVEDYNNSNNEVGNWLNNWAQEQKQKINEALPIYRENPGKALDVGDYAWWMENGSALVESAGAFVGLGYVTGGAALGALTKGSKALEWLSKGLSQANTTKKAIQGVSGLANMYMLNQAEGVGMATQVFQEKTQEALAKLKQENPKESEEKLLRLAQEEGAKSAAATISFNRTNMLLNATSAFAFLRTPALTRQLRVNPTLARTIKRSGLEGLQESGEELVNLAAENYGMDGESRKFEDAFRDTFTMEGLEAGLLGFVGGAMQTGLMSGVNELKTNKRPDGSRYSRNDEARERALEQEEAKQRWSAKSAEEKLTSTSDLFMTAKQLTELNNDLNKIEVLITNAREEGDNELVSKLQLQAQEIAKETFNSKAFHAFSTGTTEQLEEFYKGVKSLSKDEAVSRGLDGDTYGESADYALTRIHELEKEYNKSMNYLDAINIYSNRAKLSDLRSQEEPLKAALAEAEGELDKDIADLGIDTNTILDDEGIVDWNKLSKENIKIVADLESYSKVGAIATAIMNNNQRKDRLVKEYSNLTSDEYQKQFKADLKKKKQEAKKTATKQKATTKKQDAAKTTKGKKDNIETPPVDTPPVNEPPVQEEDGDSFDFPREESDTYLNDLVSFVNNPQYKPETLVFNIQENLKKEKDPTAIKALTAALDYVSNKYNIPVQNDVQKNNVDSQIDDLADFLENNSPLTVETEEDLSPQEDIVREKINKVINLMESLEQRGVNKQDFPAVAKYLQSVIGKERFVGLFNDIKDIYNLSKINPKRIEDTYEDIFYTDKQKREVLENSKTIQEATLPEGFYNYDNNEINELTRLARIDFLKEQGYTVYKSDNLAFEGLKTEIGYNKLAHLDKKYSVNLSVVGSGTFNVLNFIHSKSDISNFLDGSTDEALLDYDQINKGTEITFVPLNEVTYEDGTIVYADGTVELNGEKEIKDPNDIAPIGVKLDGVLLEGVYLHTTEWINAENIAFDDDVKNQKNKMYEIRKKVLAAGEAGITSKVTSRSNGWVLRNADGIQDTVTERLPNSQVGIAKDNKIYVGEDKTINVINKELRDGVSYTVFPVNKGQYLAMPANRTDLADKREYIDSILQAVRLYLNNNINDIRAIKLFDSTNINITTEAGLREYIGKFIYMPTDLAFNFDEFASYLSTQSESVSLFRIVDQNIEFGRGSDVNRGARFLNRRVLAGMEGEERKAYIGAAMKALDNTLSNNMTVNISKNKMGKNFVLPLITETDVTTTEMKYNDFVKDHLFTDLYSHTLSNGKEIYTIQANVEFNTDFAFIENTVVSEEATDEALGKEETTPEVKEIQVNNRTLTLNFDEEFSPTTLNENEVQYNLKSFNILTSDKAKQVFEKGRKNKWPLDKILTELQIPKEQKPLIKEIYDNLTFVGIDENGKDVVIEPSAEEIAISLGVDYSFVVEINESITNTGREEGSVSFNNEDGYQPNFDEGAPTEHYSYLTVPGGINYRENAITTPAIQNVSSKGGGYHDSEFNQSKGTMIGWFRSDEQVETKSNEIKSIDDITVNSFTFRAPADHGGDIVKYHKRDDGKWYVVAPNNMRLKPLEDAWVISNYLTSTEYTSQGTATKNRRILELQSGFQKLRDEKNLIEKEVIGKEVHFEDGTVYYVYNGSVSTLYTRLEEDFELNEDEYGNLIPKRIFKEVPVSYLEYKNDMDDAGGMVTTLPIYESPSIKSNKNDFLQLLNKNGNWVNFFVKSVIQDSVKKGYNNVLFPKGETAAKVEGHQIFIERIESSKIRIESLENQIKNYKPTPPVYTLENVKDETLIVTDNEPEGSSGFMRTPEGWKYAYIVHEEGAEWQVNERYEHLTWNDVQIVEKANRELIAFDFVNPSLESLKQQKEEEEKQIERYKTEGIDKLAPIEAFYENRVGNILSKQYKDNLTVIKDEFGNEWNSIDLTTIEDTSIDLSPKAFTEEQLQEFEDTTPSSLLVPGVPIKTQTAIIEYLSAEIIKTRTKEPITDLKALLGVALEAYNNKLAEGLPIEQHNKVERGAKVLAAVLGNFNKLTTLVEENLFSYNNLKYTGASFTVGEDIEENEDENSENDTINELAEVERNRWSSESIFTEDAKRTAGGKVKLALSHVEDVEGFNIVDGERIAVNKTSVFGLPSYILFDEIINEISGILAFSNYDSAENITQPNIESMLKTLETWVDAKPYLHNVIKKIEAMDKPTQNMFVGVMSKHYTHHSLVYKSAKGNYHINNSDSNNIAAIVQNSWLQNLINSDLIIPSDTSYVLNGEALDPILKQVGTVVGLLKVGNTKDATVLASQVFNAIGIDFDERTVDSLIRNPINYGKGPKSLLSLFTDSDGAIGKYLQRLNDLRGKDIQENHPFQDVSALSAFAKEIAKRNPVYFSNSFKDVRGKTYYSYSANKYLIDRFKRLKTDKGLLQALKAQPFSSTSYWLNMMLNNADNFFRYFRYYTFDGRKEGNSKGKKLSQMSPAEHEESKVALFFSQNLIETANKNYIVNVFYPTTSDKGLQPIISTLGHKISRNLNPRTQQLTDNGINWLYNVLVQPEVNRMLAYQANPSKHTTKGYEDGAVMFTMFPTLNMVKNVFIVEDGVRYLNPKVETDEDIKIALKTEFKKYIEELVADKKLTWEQYGFVETIEELHWDEYEREYTVVSQELSIIRDKRKNRKDEKVPDPKANLNDAAYNYVVNYLVANANIFQTLVSDPANFFKSSRSKQVIDRLVKAKVFETKEGLTRKDVIGYYSEQDFIAEHEDLFVNLGKRLAGDIAPGSDPAFEPNTTFNVAHINDEVSEAYLSAYYESLGLDYSEVNSTDAQEFTTLTEHLTVMQAEGKISKQQMNNFLDKERKGHTLSPIELDIVLQPVKPVYVNNVFRNGVEHRVYIKSSSFPLFKQLTRDLEIDKLRKAMVRDGVDRVAFGTAIKIGGTINSVTIYDDSSKGKVLDNIDLKPAILTLPRAGFKIQQEIPYKKTDAVNDGSQQRKLLTAAVRNIDGFILPNSNRSYTGAEIQQEIDNTYNSIYKLKYDALLEEVEYNIEDNTVNLEKIQKILQEEGLKRGYPLYDLEGFKLDKSGKDFIVPLWMNSSASKIEAMLNSIVDNRVRKLKPKGRSYVLGSSTGFRPTITEGTEAAKIISNTSGIIYDKAWKERGDGQLLPMRVEEGVLKPAEVMIQARLKDNKGKVINVKRFVDDKGYMDFSKLDPSILELFTYRIPTQGLNSMSYVKVVGFLPEKSGDLILAPADWTVQMGSDFDVDKVFTNSYNTLYNKETGALTKYEGDNELLKLENYLLDLHFSILGNPSKKVQKEILKPLDFGKLGDMIKEIYPVIQDLEGYRGGKGMSDEYQKFKYLNALAGGIGIGVFSNDSTFNALAQGKGLRLEYYKEDEGMVPFMFKLGGKWSNEISTYYTNANKNRSKSDVIAAYQSLSVDNENEQGLHKLNINSYTFDAIRTLAMSGFEEDVISYFLNQPIIRDYVRLQTLADDGATTFTSKDVDTELAKKYGEYVYKEEDYADLSLKELKRGLAGEQKDIQQDVLSLFNAISEYGKQIQAVQSAINTDSAGMGKDLFYAFEKENQVLSLPSKKTVANASALIGDYARLPYVDADNRPIPFTRKTVDDLISRGYVPVTPINKGGAISGSIDFIRPTTINGFTSVYALMFNNRLWERYFPYANSSLSVAFENIKSITNQTQARLTQNAELNQELFRDAKSYIIAGLSSVYTKGQLMSERKRLLIDNGENISLGNILTAIKKNGYSNVFLNRLSVRQNKVVLPTTVEYQASSTENINERALYASFSDMLLDDTTDLGEFNGISYTPRKLAQDLITSQLISGGVQKANQFVKYIPMNYLHSIGFYDRVKKIDFHQDGHFDQETYTNQHIQHNPQKVQLKRIKEFTDLGMVISDDKELITYKPTDESSRRLPRIFSIVNNNRIKGYDLYFKSTAPEAEGEWVRVSTLGYRDVTEYNPNEESTLSIIPDNNASNHIPTDPILPVTPEQFKELNKISVPSNTQGQEVFNKKGETVAEEYKLKANDTFVNKMTIVLDKIIENNYNPFNTLMAKEVVKNLDVIKDFKFILTNTLQAEASHSMKDRTIKVNLNELTENRKFEEVILEELIHALTKPAITANENGVVNRLKGFRSMAQEAVIKKLGKDGERLFNEAVEKVKNKERLLPFEYNLFYPLMNDTEFVGRLFKSKELQEILNNAPSNEEGKSILDKIWETIIEMLNAVGLDIKKGSALEYATIDIISLINQGAPSSAVQGEMQKLNPVFRTPEFINAKYKLVGKSGRLLKQKIAPQIAQTINDNYEGIIATVVKEFYVDVRVDTKKYLSKKDIKTGTQLGLFGDTTEATSLSEITNHSGGAIGSDTEWDIIGREFGMTNNKHYYFEGFKTPNGNTAIPINEALEADSKLRAANKTLGRKYPTSKEYVNNLLRRNWWQVKNSDSIVAISSITDNKVNGGTGWAVHMAIAENKPVYVFDQNEKQWYTWEKAKLAQDGIKYEMFVPTGVPILTKNFAGIGTREINEAGKEAIRDVYKNTLNNLSNDDDLSPLQRKADNIPLLKSYQDRIRTIERNIDKAKARDDFQKVEQLTAALDNLLERYQDAVKIGTKERLAQVAVKGKQDMAEIAEFFERPMTVEDTLYIRKVIHFWETSTDTLFDESERESLKLVSLFGEIQNQAMYYSDKLVKIESDYMEDFMKRYGRATTIENLFAHFRDINFAQEMTMDISRVDNDLLSAVFLAVKQANIDAVDEVRELVGDIGKREDRVIKALKAKGYKGSNLFDLFREKTASGKLTGHLVSRYSNDYSKQLRILIRQVESERDFASFTNYMNWARNNTKGLKLGYLFPTGKFSKEEQVKVDKYKADLEKELGTVHFNEFMKVQKDKLEKYNKYKQDYLRRLMDDNGLTSLQEVLNNPVASKAYSYWQKANSPYEYYKQINGTTDQTLKEHKGYRVLDYIVQLPSKETSYDSNFKAIENDTELYEFYNYFSEIDRELKQYMPTSDRVKLAFSGIPHIEKSIFAAYNEKGMKAGLAPIWQEIKKSIREEPESNIMSKTIDSVTGVEDKFGTTNMGRNNRNVYDNYVFNKSIEYKAKTGEDPTPEMLNTWQEDIVDELAQKKSYDLPKVLRVYAMTVLAYKHKAKIEDSIKLAQNILSTQQEVRRTNTGEDILDEGGRLQYKPVSESFIRTKAQFAHYIDSLYGNVNKAEGMIDKKKFTSDEKKSIKELEDKLATLEEGYANDNISIAEYNNAKTRLQDQIDEIGGYEAWSKRGDLLLKYIQLKGMGWNAMSAIANIGFGSIANIIEGEGGQLYTSAQLRKGYRLTMGSIGRNATFNRTSPGESKKIRSMMDKWDILKDASHELYESPMSIELSKRHKWLSPYNLTQRTEYINQAPLMIAMMLNTPVKGSNGEVTNLWEVMDENGNLIEGVEVSKDVVNKLRIRIDQIVKRNHGNYDPNSPLAMKKHFVGRALGQFRTWMFEGIAVRFESKKFDPALGIEVKGRYLSAWDYFTNDITPSKIFAVFEGLVKFQSFGKLFKESTFEQFGDPKDFTEVDVANMRRFVAELAIYIDIYIAYMMLAMFAEGLDDDDELTRVLLNHMINQGLRLRTDITFYTSPAQLKQMLRDPIPAMSIVKDTGEWIDSTVRLIKGDDEIKSGVYSENSRWLRESAQMLPFATQGYRIFNYGIQSFDK